MKSLILLLNLKIYLFLVKLGLPRGAGLFLGFVTREVNSEGKYTVLCLGRSIFLDDVKAVTKYASINKYIYFEKGLIGKIVRRFLTSTELAENNYYSSSEFIPGREQTRTFIRKMFPVLRMVLRFDAVMSCNIGYVDQQEFFVVAKEFNVPVIILYKEGLAIKQYIADYVKIYGNHVSHADMLLCYNEIIKKALSRANITGLLSDKIKVSGIPRLDCYSHESKREKNQITLFSFFPQDKTTYFVQDSHINEEVFRLSEQFHYMVIRYAYEHPECDVVVKTKVAEHYLQYVEEIRSKHFADVDIPNLLVTNNADSNSLVMTSKIVLGFNSTVLIEGILAGKQVVTPDLSKLFKKNVPWDYFFEYPDLVNYVDSYDELVSVLANENVQSPQIHKKLKKKFLKEYMFSDDGSSSKRVESAVTQLLDCHNDLAAN